ATLRLLRAHHDRSHDLALLDRALRRGRLHGTDDDVSDAGVAPVRPAHDADAEQRAGARVVGDADPGFLLDHGYFATSRTSARRQCFVFDNGRVSTMRTVSPTFAWFCSSWAWNFVVRRTIFL